MEERQKITDKIVNFYDFFIAELMAKYQEQIDADEKKRISDNMNILKNFQLYLKEEIQPGLEKTVYKKLAQKNRVTQHHPLENKRPIKEFKKQTLFILEKITKLIKF